MRGDDLLTVRQTGIARLAGRVPRRFRRRVPARLRNALVVRLGHPVEPFDPAAHPRRVNLGCGFDKRPGYLNIDGQAFHEPDLLADVRSLPQLPSGAYEEVVAQDVLEHLRRADGAPALTEWARLLAPGGRLWMRVPNVLSLLHWMDLSDDPERHSQIMHFLFGTQAYEGDFHLSGYTDVLLCDQLGRNGLVRIAAELRDEWLWEVESFAPDGRMTLPAAVFWGRGFHGRESGAWRWSAGQSEMLLYSFDGPLPARLELEVEHGVTEIVGVADRLVPGSHSIELELQRGANRLRFHSSTREHAEGDDRELAFRLDGAVLHGDGVEPWSCL